MKPGYRPHFEPRDPGYDNRVRTSFGRQSAMATLGISIEDVGPGWVEFGFERRESLTQQHGLVHAGVIATAMDSACGYAAFSLMPADAAVLTVEYKINLLNPADSDQYLVNGWVVKPGRTLTVCQAETTPVGETRATAVMTATIMTLVGSKLDS